MFEKYNIDDLYYCSIESMVPFGMTNFGGAISIESFDYHKYETIVFLRNGKYYDINNLKRVINVVKCPQREMPVTSDDGVLYIIDEDSLVPYRQRTSTTHNTLQRLPFGMKKYI